MKRAVQKIFATGVFLLAGSQPSIAQLIDNSNGTISDANQQIMWLKDAGLAQSRTHAEALDWITGLNDNAHLGYSDWRLPAGTDPRADSSATTPGGQYFYNATGSELGYLFYLHLSGCSNWHIQTKCEGFSQVPNDDPDLLLFDNLPPLIPVNGNVYWTQMESTSNTGFIWAFGFNNGSYREHLDDGTKRFRGWAVRDAFLRCLTIPFWNRTVCVSPIPVAFAAAALLAAAFAMYWYRRRPQSG